MYTYTLHNELALSITVEDNKILNTLENLLKALSFKPVKDAPDLPTLHWQFKKKLIPLRFRIMLPGCLSRKVFQLQHGIVIFMSAMVILIYTYSQTKSLDLLF